MAAAFRVLDEIHFQGDLVRARSDAATVRALLDELDRIVPPTSARPHEDARLELCEQLVEELARLGCRLLECAVAEACC